MTAIDYDAFWSYTHDDNDRLGGRVLALARALQDEFAVTTADDLNLFIDRSSLQWGSAWADTIDGAITQAPFFIPVITPKYVRSEACRQEFLTFSGIAKSRGLDKLVLPILYINVPGLSADSDDEVLALIARTQFVDWTELRLRAPDDTSVLQAVNKLALTLVDLQSEIGASTLQQEIKTAAEVNDDVIKAVESIGQRLDAWMESVEFDKIAGAQWRASMDARIARIHRLRSSRSPKSAEFAVLVQLGRDLLPLAQDRLEKAKDYARLTIELDPYVKAAIRLISINRARTQLLDALRDGVNEAFLNIEPPEGQEKGFRGLGADLMGQNRHLDDAERALRKSYTFVAEGNDLVMQWREQLIALDGPQTVVLAR
ncbi:toll/interleukin-1 receptor domain-containing protein [Salinibacterium sp. ZJ454]|uniref:toll/interleukin-1 receptor domain-containing protein n=1 Tax=Salinibacterium sp. ZJ454 TaxID=2708339 RepID=UPI00141E0200|nr:toll/interleukin-1 receptor domain-containing protein [Salinibacterium sp. ZJ454]